MKTSLRISLFLALLFIIFSVGSLKAQNLSLLNSDSAYKAAVPSSGRIWGYMFGDAYYKAHADSFARGGSNQYSGIPKNRTAFQFRRIYLGYDYNITSKFSAELLLAAEDNFPAGNPPGTAPAVGGDETFNNKLAFYIKLANIRVKSIWKGTDLVVGQVSTPAFPGLSEKVWSYRSIERTITDIRRTPSYDLGAALQGTFDPATKNFGYNLMVGNGSSAKPEGDNFKWFYGDVYAYLAHKHIVIDAYADYERLNWVPTWHHSRQMLKGFIAYNSSATDKSMNPGTGYTIGVEGFINNLKNDVFASKIAGGADTLSDAASGISMYIHGDIITNKLRFFARVDLYNPMNKVDNSKYNLYKQNTGNYNDNTWTGATFTTPTNDETYKQLFLTAGLDFHPAKNVHFMPNVWYNNYKSQIGYNSKGNDMVYRITFFFAFGKNYDNGGF